MRDYSQMKTEGVPLLILREMGVLTKQFWLDHGATYSPGGGIQDRECVTCGFIGNINKYFRSDPEGARFQKCTRCSSCRAKTAARKAKRKAAGLAHKEKSTTQ